MAKGRSLTQILKDTRKKIGILNKDVSRLENIEEEAKGLRGIKERESKRLGEITEIIEGLRRTKEECKRKDYYEGKYDPSYRYVDKIEGDKITPTEDFKPGMRYSCPECGSSVPVLRYYHQEYDSPEGDTWVTKALAICCDKIYEIKKIEDRN